MAQKKKQAATTSDLWGEESVREVARRETSEFERAHRKTVWMRRLLFASVFILFPFTALVALAGWTQEAPSFSASTAMSAPGRAEATRAVIEWLDHDPSPLPGAIIQAWDGAEEIEWPLTDSLASQADENDLPVKWNHEFTLAVPAQETDTGMRTSDTRYYLTQVMVEVTKKSGVVVLTKPSIIPVPPSVAEGSGQLGTWPNTVPGTLPQPAVEAIDKWALAYVGPDPVALKLATGDPTVENAYTPLAGVKDVSVQIGQSAFIVSSKDEKTSDLMVATVTLTLDRKADDNQTSLPTATLDLLIDQVNSGSPKVVAWGSPGTGHLLTPYENAVNISRLTTQEGQDQESQQSGIAPQSGDIGAGV